MGVRPPDTPNLSGLVRRLRHEPAGCFKRYNPSSECLLKFHFTLSPQQLLCHPHGNQFETIDGGMMVACNTDMLSVSRKLFVPGQVAEVMQPK